MRADDKRKIVEYLKEDKIKNCNILNFIEDYRIHSFIREGDSVLVKGTSDHDWIYFSSSSEDEFIKLLSYTKNEQYFVVTDDWMIPLVVNDGKMDWKLSCVKLYFPDDALVSEPKHVVCKLSTSDAEYIYENSKYKDFTSVEYIVERIIKGVALGIKENGKLIAWLMTHDDGAIGFLNVQKEYRKKGYGHSLTMESIKELRKQGKIPFVHIEEDNIKSMNLAQKIGFSRYGKIHWIKRINF